MGSWLVHCRTSIRRRSRSAVFSPAPLLSFRPIWITDSEGKNRIRNKAKLKAQELVDPRNTALRNILQKAEFAIMAGDDVVDEDDNGATGSASDSD